jgi:hypothetical protein
MATVQSRQVDGKDIHVIDGLFQPETVWMIYEGLKDLPFLPTEYDTEERRGIPHLNFEFDPERLSASPALCVLRDCIVARTRELFAASRLNLVRVHCNNQPYGDLQLAHTDLVPGVTSLYFANADWPAEWQGETIFYDSTDEPYHAVMPKPGRVVVFPGDLLHRGGVPSSACKVTRLSMAFKFSATGQSANADTRAD